MPDQTQTEPETDEVRERAIDAAKAVFDRVLLLSSPPRHTVAEALEAAAAVYDADSEAAVQRMMEQSLLLGMEVGPEGLTASVTLAREIAAKMVFAAKQFLSEFPDARNYVQQQVIDRETGDRYEVIFVRPTGKSPHELREEADRERARANERIAALHDALTRVEDDDPEEFATPESTVEYVVGRYRAMVTAESQAADEVQRLRGELTAIADMAYRAGPAGYQDALTEIQARARRAAAA